jgi:hypothetical protein
MASKEESRSVNIYINGDQADQTLKQLRATARTLNNELGQLVPGTQAFKEKAEQLSSVNTRLKEVKNDVNGVGGAFNDLKENFTGVFAGLGIGLGIAELVSFGKELVDIEVKASGVERAFERIGDTTGLIEKLRQASHGMIADLDLKKMAVQANEFNVPLSKLPLLLEFATQRARDMAKPVDEIAEKLIEGLGRKGGRSLVELGISTSEFNAELSKTPDRIEAIANIIKRRLGDAGEDMDAFGDKVLQTQTMWQNFKEWLAGLPFNKPDQGDGLDKKDIDAATKKERERFKNFETLKNDEVAAAIVNLNARAQKLKDEQKKIAAQVAKDIDSGDGSKSANLLNQLTENSRARMAVQNVLGELRNRSANLATQEALEGKSGTIKYIDTKIAALQKLQKEVDKTTKAWKDHQAQIDALEKQKDAIAGKSASEIKAGENAKAKQARELKEYQAQLQDVRFQIDELIGSATKGTIAGLDAQLKIIDDKYKKLIAKLTELNKNRKATGADKAANNKQIGELKTDDMAAQLLAGNDAFYKNDSGVLKNHYANKKDDLKNQYDKNLIDKKTYDAQLYKLEQEELEKEYILQLQYGMSTQDTENKLAKNEIDNKKRVAEAAKEYLKLQLEQEKEFLKAKEAVEEAKQQLAMDSLGVLSQVFGQNKALMLAELALEKIIAIGKIETSKDVEIAGYYEKYAAIPFGEIPASILAAAAQTRAGLAIADVIATGVGQAISDVSGGTKKYADGGYSAVDYSNPSGWVNRPTLFKNSSSGNPFIAGEGHKTEYIVSSEQLKNPQIADFVNTIEAHRTVKRFENGGYSNAMPKAYSQGGYSGGGQTSQRLDRLEAMVSDHVALFDKQAKINARPVVISRRAWEIEDAKVAAIRNAANAK